MRKNTSAETTTLALVRAAHRERTVTITYRKPGADQEEVRTVEVERVEVTEQGDYLVVGWDRTRQDRRSFRIDRVTHYTVHGFGWSAAHRAFLSAEQVADLLSDLDEPTSSLITASDYAAHGDWLANEADKAERRGDQTKADELWDLADVAWELAGLS